MKNQVRTRFAPSPTGFLHVGGLRTALFAYLWAKKNRGKFFLRIEDTDRERLVEGAEKYIIDKLEEFGLRPDEISRQSDRLSIYKKFSAELLKSGRAIEERTEKGTAIRFSLSKSGTTEWEDLVYGKMSFRNSDLKDPIILKSDGYPVYNFANVIDDHDMAITHVTRGEEFLSSTPIHIQLYQAFGWEMPHFAHLPLILDKQRKKLSKRSNDVMVDEYLKKGYLKQSLLNFIALLGWSPKTTKEIFSLEELVKEFELSNINKAGAIFDIAKLDFIDREWRLRLAPMPSTDQLYKSSVQRISEILSQDKEINQTRMSQIEAVIPIIYPQILERIQGPSNLAEHLPEFMFYFRPPEYAPNLLIWKTMTHDQVRNNLEMQKKFIESLKPGDFDALTLEEKFKNFLSGQGIALGEALWPLRVALSGQKNSPSPFEIMEVFAKSSYGPEEIIKRIDSAIKLLS